MTLTCSRSKASISVPHTPPKAQIFVCFAPRWAGFELLPNCEKWAPNDPEMTLTCSSQKYPWSYFICIWGIICSPFWSTINIFRVMANCWENMHRTTPTWPCHVQAQWHASTAYAHEDQFSPVSPYDELLSRKLRFWISYWVYCKHKNLLLTFVKLKIVKIPKCYLYWDHHQESYHQKFRCKKLNNSRSRGCEIFICMWSHIKKIKKFLKTKWKMILAYWLQHIPHVEFVSEINNLTDGRRTATDAGRRTMTSASSKPAEMKYPRVV